MVKRSDASKKNEESKLGGFLRGFRVSASPTKTDGRETSSVSNKRPKEKEHTENNKTQGENRARSKSRARAKSASRRHQQDTNDIRLRSKSPSRQRIEEFMNEVRARERSLSREKNLRIRGRSRDRQSPSTHHHQQHHFARSLSRVTTSDDNFQTGSTPKRRDCSSKSSRGKSIERELSKTGTRKNVSIERKWASSGERKRGMAESRSVSERSLNSRNKRLLPREMDEESSSSSEEEENALYQMEESKSVSSGAIPGKSPSRKLSLTAIRQTLFKRPSFLKEESDSPVSVVVTTGSENPEAWFRAIARRDWEQVNELIEGYDYKKYATRGNGKTQKKLRVLKYLSPSNGMAASSGEDLVSPLLKGDANGRTPLHAACKEHMPWKMAQSIFFLERSAATVLDDDDRTPLHLAVIANHDTRLLDKLIYANSASLFQPDTVTGRTPFGYAILRAEFKRNKDVTFTWRKPLNNGEAAIQSAHTEHWDNVQFLLDTLVSRRKPLSKAHDSELLLESIRALAPPSIIATMLSVSARILQQDPLMAEEVLSSLVISDYPIDIIQKTVKVCAETMPQNHLINCIRSKLVDYFDKGRISHFREEFKLKTTFRNEVVQTYKRMSSKRGLRLTDPCQEWWDKLKFLLGYSADGSMRMHELDEVYLLHAACKVPQSPVGLIEHLVRLFPSARSETELDSEALPIHHVCLNLKGVGAIQALKAVTAADSVLTRKRYRGRTPLQYAILRGQTWAFIKTILCMNPKVVNAVDPWTRLYPFQLAALPQDEVVREIEHLNKIYRLLRLNPIVVDPMLSCGTGDPMGDFGSVAQHVLNWCYSYTNKVWTVDRPHLQLLRSAITEGEIPEVMSVWFNKLKTLIWKAYDQKNAGKRIIYMPHEDVYLLHAALSSGGTPPIAIELLLELFPEAMQTPKPGTEEYPIHIAAAGPTYTPMPFETVISLRSSLEMMVLAYPEAVKLKCCDRNIVQIAIAAGKSWQEIEPILDAAPAFIGTRDFRSALLPYQLVAASENIMPLQKWMQSKTFATKWGDRSPAENGRLLMNLRRRFDCETLSSVYVILHRTLQGQAE